MATFSPRTLKVLQDAGWTEQYRYDSEAALAERFRKLGYEPNPAALHFFVFDPQALWIHGGLLAATAVLAALYPMRIVARLPIAATLRDEVME